MIPETNAPFFVKPYADASGGVDYLGIRAVNLALMDEFLPSINNVTRFIRPYSVMAWAAWAFREKMQAQGQQDAKRSEFEQFREKLEVLFGWSHQIHQAGVGLVGNAQRQPEETRTVPLSFDAWSRNVSWLDAVNYGPSLKTDNGLGFLVQVIPGVFAVTDAGENLAAAFDKSLHRCARYAAVKSLSEMTGSAELAEEVYPYWKVSSPSKSEADAFRKVFYQPEKVEERTRTGRRSAAISLILWALQQQEAPVTVTQLRRYMTLYELPRDLTNYPYEPLARMQGLWKVLQLRQAQRLAAEALFGWIELEILGKSRSLSSQIVYDLIALLKEDAGGKPLPEYWVKDEVDQLRNVKGNSASYLNSAQSQGELDVFEQMSLISDALSGDRDSSALVALKILILCAEVTRELENDERCQPYLGVGGAARVSLLNWKKFVLTNRDLPLRVFLTSMIENYFLSQHFGIAAARYTEGTQRLRITIEEGGLVSMLNSMSDAWHPNVTADRLESALSLMADCRLVSRVSEDEEVRYRATAILG